MWFSPQRRAHSSKRLQELHDLRAGGFPIVVLAPAPRTCVPKLQGIPMIRMANVPATVFLERLRIARAQQISGFAVLKSPHWCSGT
eukprot:7748395-Pyramimonas_sp.AAC.1